MVVTRNLTDTASANTASNIQLGSCVTAIGVGAFSGYTNITSMEFPESLTVIDSGAFSSSSISSVDLPSGLTRINDKAFSRCNNLRKIEIPDNVVSIGASAFTYCTNLSECTIGSGITSIGNNLFSGSTNFKKMKITASVPPSINSNTFNGSYQIYVPCQSYDDYISAPYWSNYSSRIVCDDIPFKVKYYYSDGSFGGLVKCDSGNSLTSTIVNNSYTDDFTKVELGDCIDSVGYGAFNDKNGITEVVWDTTSANTLTTFNTAFNRCTNAYFPDLAPNMTMIRSSFQGCNFNNLTINSGVTLSGGSYYSDAPFCNSNIGNLHYDCVNGASGAFNGSYINSLTFGDNISVLDKGSFIQCSGFTDVVLPSGVTSVGDYSFRDCKDITAVTIHTGSIGGSAFERCYGLKKLTLDSGVTSGSNSYMFMDCSGLTKINSDVEGVGYLNINYLPWGAFRNCGIEDLTLGENMSYIRQSVFSYSNLRKVHIIGNSGTTIQSTIFGNCPNFTELEIDNCGTISWNGGSIFGNTLKKVTIGGGAIDVLNFSGNSLTDVILKDGVTTIPEKIFSGQTSLSSITMPNSVTTIGASAFTNCRSVTDFHMTSGVTFVGNKAFSGWTSLSSLSADCSNVNGWFSGVTSLSSVTFGSGVRIIGDNAFSNCSSLSNINLHSGITSIGIGAFMGCTNLPNITIPSGVTSIANYTFYGCSGFTSVNIPSGITSIGSSAFQNCGNLTRLTLNRGLTTIGSSAFRYCSIDQVDIPNTVTTIGDYSFDNCKLMTSVIIPSNVISIGGSAFSNCGQLNTVIVTRSTPPTLGSGAFSNTSCTIYVPQESYDLYVNAENWSAYASRIQPISNS